LAYNPRFMIPHSQSPHGGKHTMKCTWSPDEPAAHWTLTDAERQFLPDHIDYNRQRLRSSSQPLQGGQIPRGASETELASKFVDTELALMPFPFQDAKSDQAAGDMM
jgi:hypothetical protein